MNLKDVQAAIVMVCNDLPQKVIRDSFDFMASTVSVLMDVHVLTNKWPFKNILPTVT